MTTIAGAFNMSVFRPVFEFGREQQPALKVHMLPPKMQNFSKASARKDEQAQRCRNMAFDHGAPTALRNVLRCRFCLVNFPWNANGLGFANCGAKPL